jgi:iron complex outermembrane receptor protein
MSEHLTAYEAGYRLAPSRHWSIDIAGFYDAHHGVITNVEGNPFVLGGTPAVTVLPLYFSNQFNPRVYGAELAAAWTPTRQSSLRVSYSWLQGGIETASEVEGPGHQFHARWFWTLPHNVEWDSGYFFTDHYSGVPAYHRVDKRLGWRLSPHWEISITGQHLLDKQHIESPALFAVPTEIGRSVYGKLTWRFGER